MESSRMALAIAQLSSTRPATATFVSPLTGELTLYERHGGLWAVEPAAAFDTITMRDSLNQQIYQEGIDGVCSEIRHYQSSVLDYIETDVYLPIMDTSGASSSYPSTLAAPLVIALAVVKIIAALVVLVAAVGIVIYVVGEAWHNWKMDEAYPKLYFFRSPDGTYNGFFTREECVTLKASYYPDMWIDPTTTLMVDPNKPDAQEKINWIINNTPSDWGLPKDINFGIGDIVIWVVVGAVAIAGLYITAKVITRKKGE